MKPDFVFFGESIREQVKDRRYAARQEIFGSSFFLLKLTIAPKLFHRRECRPTLHSRHYARHLFSVPVCSRSPVSVPFWNFPHSSHSLLKRALELHKPVLYVNVGPTRADGLPGIDKLEVPTSVVMTDVVYAVV